MTYAFIDIDIDSPISGLLYYHDFYIHGLIRIN